MGQFRSPQGDRDADEGTVVLLRGSQHRWEAGERRFTSLFTTQKGSASKNLFTP